MADPLDVLAESYRGIQESTHVMAQVAVRLERGQQDSLRLLRALSWMQGLTIAFLGVMVLGFGWLLWLALDAHHALAVHTQALAELLGRLHEEMRHDAL
jgi:hypothetical protein